MKSLILDVNDVSRQDLEDASGRGIKTCFETSKNIQSAVEEIENRGVNKLDTGFR